MGTPRYAGLDAAFLLLDLLQRIPRRRYISSSQLLQQLQSAGYTLQRRTLQRHLDLLVQRFPLECDTRSKPYGYRWAEGAQGLNLPTLAAPEALLLQLAHSELAPLLPARTLHSLAPLFDSARLQLERSHPKAAQRWLHKTRRVPDALPLLAPALCPGIFDSVSEALYAEHTLHLSYRNALGRSLQAEVWPLGLVLQGQRLYLVCRFVGYDNERIIALARIQQARVGTAFAYPEQFELERYIEDGHFGIRRGALVRVRFRLPKALAQHLIESPLAADQHCVDEGDSVHISATLHDTELLQRWLRGWGEQLRELQIEAVAPAATAGFYESSTDAQRP